MILSSLSICGICGSLPKYHLPMTKGMFYVEFIGVKKTAHTYVV